MIALPIVMFVIGVAAVLSGYAIVTQLPEMISSRRVSRRLREVGTSVSPILDESTVVMHASEGPLPMLDRMAARTQAGSWLTHLIEQSGQRVTPSAIVVAAVGIAAVLGIATAVFSHVPMLGLPVAMFGASTPFLWLMHQRTVRIKRFEEQFPEALDLLSRAIRAGHAFQTAMGMVGDELPQPIGIEFKRAFEQQNFGLPLREALNTMSDRVPLIDVHFFVTAVLIQRETGGNLAEILDNLAHVVRERFKILRQVRVHTAHGRLTGYVLLALPATLGIVLSYLNPEHMGVLFTEHMGQVMLIVTVILQTVGFFWIKQVVKIEV